MTTTTNSLITWPTLLTDAPMTVHTSKPKRSKTGLVKSMTVPPPPDVATVQRLNELAAKHPFSTPHKVKKHDTL